MIDAKVKELTMPEALPERRRHVRQSVDGDFQVLVDDIGYPAELSDISPLGMQARVDPLIFDEIREKIDAVRFGDRPPLAVTIHWGFFDGQFGASFKDELEAQPVVENYLASLR